MNEWYGSDAGRSVLAATELGKLLFIWEAELVDGQIVRQFEEHVCMRAFKDDGFVPSLTLAISTDTLDRKTTKVFRLIPTAYAKKNTPWFQSPYQYIVNLEAGEELIAHWMTDDSRTGKIHTRLSRTVMGAKKANGEKHLVVISPSGKVTLSNTEDMSFEGE